MPRGTGAPRNLSLGGPHDRRRHAQSEGLHDHLEAQETRRPETGPPVLVARSRGAILRFPSTCLHRSWWVGAPRGVSMPGRPQYEACMRDGPPGRCDLPAGAVLVMPSPMRPPAMPASGRGRRHCSLRSCSHVVVELVEPLLSRGRPEGSGGRGAPHRRVRAISASLLALFGAWIGLKDSAGWPRSQALACRLGGRLPSSARSLPWCNDRLRPPRAEVGRAPHPGSTAGEWARQHRCLPRGASPACPRTVPAGAPSPPRDQAGPGCVEVAESVGPATHGARDCRAGMASMT